MKIGKMRGRERERDKSIGGREREKYTKNFQQPNFENENKMHFAKKSN